MSSIGTDLRKAALPPPALMPKHRDPWRLAKAHPRLCHPMQGVASRRSWWSASPSGVGDMAVTGPDCRPARLNRTRGYRGKAWPCSAQSAAVPMGRSPSSPQLQLPDATSAMRFSLACCREVISISLKHALPSVDGFKHLVSVGAGGFRRPSQVGDGMLAHAVRPL